jgi:hypothetical protein
MERSPAMLLELVLPNLPQAGEAGARIDVVHCAPGDALARNARLLEFTVGLDDAAAHDCPPVTTYRMILSEPAVVRTIEVTPGTAVPAGSRLALLATAVDDPADGEPVRRARATIAAILVPPAW